MRYSTLTIGKGKDVAPTEYPRLYHLTDYHSYSHCINSDTLSSKTQHYVSTTYDPNMNAVGGRHHYDFKFVLNGSALIEKYSGFHYVDSYRTSNGERHAYDEREIGISTQTISPLSQYLLGTVLLFDMFSVKSIQWLLYRLNDVGGKSAAPQAINSLYEQLYVWKKPVWVGDTNRRINDMELRFIHDVYKLSQAGGSFKDGMVELTKHYPIVTHDGEALPSYVVERQFKSGILVKWLNDYYANRKMIDVTVPEVRALIRKCLNKIGIGNNAVEAIMGAIERAGLFDPVTPPVEWGSILNCAIDGDIEGAMEHAEYFGKNGRKQREYFANERNPHMVHHGTQFGRLSWDR